MEAQYVRIRAFQNYCPDFKNSDARYLWISLAANLSETLPMVRTKRDASTRG